MATAAETKALRFHRKVSPLERIFTLLARIDPPFSNQMVLEGTGEFDLAQWQRAVAAACEANPGSRLILQGRWAWARWMDSGVAAPVRLFDGANWSGRGSDGAPFFFDPLPFETDYSCEVVLVSGNPLRVAFRTLHATMDGIGTLIWAQDIFRALQGEPLVGSASTINDDEFVAQSKYKVQWRHKPKKCRAPSGAMDGNALGYVWKRTQLQGHFPKLLPKMAIAIARETRKQGPGDVRLNIPVDLRRRSPGGISTANLTRRIVLDVAPEDTVETLIKQIKDKLANLSGDSRILKLLSYLPLGWIEFGFKTVRRKNLRTNLYRSTGTISNLGRLPIESFHGGGFKARSGFYVSPGTEAKPIFMTLAGYDGGVEMIVSMPTSLASKGRLDRFIENVTAGLTPD